MGRVLGIDRVVGVIFLLFSLGYLWSSRSIIESSFGDTLGPVAFPRMLGVLMACLAIGMIVKGAPKGERNSVPFNALVAIVVTVVLVGAFVLLLPVIGFGPIVFLVTLSFLLALREKLLVSIGYSALLTAIFYVAFAVLLGTPFPRSSWAGLI